jgi:ankyrin repeat protein
VRYVIFVIMLFYGMGFNELHSVNKFNGTFISVFFLPQQEPFYFQKPVPSTVKLRGKIDLSFFRNQPVVSQYRFRLVPPDGGATLIDRNLFSWSAWISFNFIEIVIPILDREGGYKLVIEYRTPKNSEISKFEKPFYVYRANAMVGPVIAESKSTTSADKPVTKTEPVTDNTAQKAAPVTEKRVVKTAVVTNKPETETLPATTNASAKMIPVADRITIEKVKTDQKQIKLVSIEKEEINTAATSIQVGKIFNESSVEPRPDKIINALDYNKLLAEAIENKDAALFRKSVQNGAGSEITGADGGNIFHLIDNDLADEEIVSMLTKNGISIDEKDNYGNSPLHTAILKGNNDYARILINQRVNLNSMNLIGLSPLHVAAFLNNEEVLNQMLLKGAEIDIKGNTGYTPLHIAAEMNHIALAKDLLYMGANSKIKTDQKLTPKTIAKIQGNNEIVKLIGKKGSYNINQFKPVSIDGTTLVNSSQLTPKYDFKLPYDQELAKKRHSKIVLQALSVPVFVIGTAGLAYFKSEANNYYSLYKTAETEEMARDLYNKANSYDTYAYISGGISLASIFGFIHSAIRKKHISGDMRKRFN